MYHSEAGTMDESQEVVISSHVEEAVEHQPSYSGMYQYPPVAYEDDDVQSQHSRQSSRSGREQAASKGARGVHRGGAGKKRCTCRRLLLATVICIALAALIIGLLYYFLIVQDEDQPQPVAACGDCHCIADQDLNGTTTECPETPPPTSYPSDMISALQAQEWLNPLELNDCDPFADGECAVVNGNQTIVPTVDDDSEAVCGLHYNDTNECSGYELVTYDQEGWAAAKGAFVTHTGPCGVCSSLTDLAAFMTQLDMTTAGQDCGREALVTVNNGVDCFRDKLGLSESCATLWAHRARHSGRECAATCLLEDVMDQAYNGPVPSCALSDCLQCEEDSSAAVFTAYAGRTRRSSGLLSAIVRQCDEIADIAHTTSCPETTKLQR